jgi:hypothetical protein
VRRQWVDTHSKSIHADPGIYLPGEIFADEPTEAADPEYAQTEATTGSKKRKVSKGSDGDYSVKIRKTMDGSTPSITSLTVIDDRRPDLMLIDCTVDEGIPLRPYGRHACLFIEVKVAASEKPNPCNMVRVSLINIFDAE